MPRASIGRIRRNCARRQFTHWLRAAALKPIGIGKDDKRPCVLRLRGHDRFVDRGDNFGFVAMWLRGSDQGVRRRICNALSQALPKLGDVHRRVILMRDLLQLRRKIV
jgi:hypothetical protein